MKITEHYLKSNYYLITIYVMAFLAFISTGPFQIVNQYIFVSFLLILSVLLISFKNTIYTIPVIFALMYSYNQLNPNLNMIDGFNFIYLIPASLFTSIIIHLIRFKPTFKMGVLTKPYLWIAVAYIASIFYVDITITYIQLSFVGFIYLLLYQFYLQTSHTDESYLVRILFFASLLLVLEFTYSIAYGFFTENTSLSLINRVLIGMEESWYREDYGFGNINDVAIHLTLLIGAQFYYSIKYPKQILFWIVPLFSGFIILLTASRGGYIGILTAYIIFIPYMIKNTTKIGKKHALYVLLLVCVALTVLNPLIKIAFNLAVQGGFDNLDNFTSDRTILYKNALTVFKKYPIFGGGWEAMVDRVNPDRIQVFHSTIFQTLAVMGIFGIISLIYYFHRTFKYLFKNRSLIKDMLLIGIISSQVVGLVDNTMYMLLYTIATLMIFSLLENKEHIS